MIKFNKATTAFCVFAMTTLGFAVSASAQKYKTAADTVKLNKEYGEVTLEISKLNSKLIAQQNKTAGYQSKSASTAQDAVTSAQGSKETASTATNGNVGDAKKAMKQARKANNQANDAKDAMDNQKDNVKDMKDLNEKIDRKKQKLADLDKQRAAIMALTAPVVKQQ
ncbi:hypothetical protein DIU31_024485 [Mucilaginibacter rubeus]|uniref:SlyB protein n=1 Tax=Mucilaginibacter rubeus TaxID=2027860 RepID=A0AAE6JJE9_9SPHI|nr:MULTISPECIES: hypothetical protein [Mucilaginibacter]QEM06518.1 hypothetical protein DIU31_024485 [Mucilaginibacter rubeus]QEM19107.1 hypothetical protein DIU38_024750 [Mucilaginibacter gossypii]QTE44352.1 hypothetical protein J3L19_02970 [Mucilaginibacter rubeus]QTE50952.1 hypothetical protein J3L21_02945 [Mucilaginibacter rubeus]QTE56035.1 hypothetical protein J3L23_28180 [Mucilaginibacter rubeus]